MNNAKSSLLACAFVLAATMFAACGGSTAPVAPAANQPEKAVTIESAAAPAKAAAATRVPAATPESATSGIPTENNQTATAAPAVDAVQTPALPAKSDAAEGDAAAVRITLNGNSIAVDGDGATAGGGKVTITSAGTYRLSGSLADGQIIVDSKDEEDVTLILDGVHISSSTSAPIFIQEAGDAVIVLASGSHNTVTDGDSYVTEDPASDEPNAAIFSKADLTIEGDGSLTVDGRHNDGIAGKDDVVIAGGALIVNAVDDGIRGKDSVVVKAGRVTVNAQGDGLKSDNADDAARGYVAIEDGVVNITSGGDAITAQTDVRISGGEITLAAGGGSRAFIDQNLSAKGIKGIARVEIGGGSFAIDAADDAIHSNAAIVIQGGSFNIATGDDAVHADATVEINGGDLRVTECYEGIESAVITINDGDIHIVSSDDGLNVVGGNDGSGMGGRPGRGGAPGGMPGQDRFAETTSQYLKINGGAIVIDAGGDGLDINGAIEMTDGVLLVNGPTENMNGPLDYNVSFKITGGFLVAAGSAGMAQAPDESSTQPSVLLNLSSMLRAGTLVHLQSSSGEDLLTFAPVKEYQSVAFSSPALTQGATIDVYFGGNSSGTATDGLYQDGSYSGTKAGSVTLSGITTYVGGGRRR